MYRIVWQFDAHADRVGEFERVYGMEGPWAMLFRSGEGYLGTELFRSTADPNRFLTVDRWTSRAAYDAFRATRHQDYAVLDSDCARLTRAELLIAYGEEP
jgi:quinol monooxygenase YgiN